MQVNALSEGMPTACSSLVAVYPQGGTLWMALLSEGGNYYY